MADSNPRIAALISQVAALEAAVRTGSAVAAAPSRGYPFLAKLSGEDLLAAQTVVQENAVLRKQVQAQEEVLEERD
jgi:hypothetical protein